MMRAPAARARQRGFFDFSFPELVITFGVALVVLGPKKLPGLVQQVGRWVGRARHMARQFREQLEQEVNSINAVKPVPRHVAPEVGPAAPGTEPTPDAAASSAAGDIPATAENPGAAPDTSAAAPAVESAGNDVHPEAQIYFALNGTEPAVVSQDPYAPAVGVDDPQASAQPAAQQPANAEHAAGNEAGHETGHEASPPKAAEPAQPATVEVIFPHDHG